jgi:hypothetical protein
LIPDSATGDYGRLAEVLVWAEESEALSAPTTDQAHADTTPSLEWLHNFANRHGLIVQRREPWNGGWRLILNECPFNPEHRGTSAALFVTVNGGFASSASTMAAQARHGTICDRSSSPHRTLHIQNMVSIPAHGQTITKRIQLQKSILTRSRLFNPSTRQGLNSLSRD